MHVRTILLEKQLSIILVNRENAEAAITWSVLGNLLTQHSPLLYTGIKENELAPLKNDQDTFELLAQ